MRFLGRSHRWQDRGPILLLTAVLVIVLDQVTKTWALHSAVNPRHVIGPVNFVLTFNKGAAFSLGSGAGSMVEAVVAVLIVVLVMASGRARKRLTVQLAVFVGMVIGGAIGNLIDRVVRGNGGGVIDFVQLVSWWPVFNLADAAITLGAIGIVLSWKDRSRSETETLKDETSDSEQQDPEGQDQARQQLGVEQ